MQDRELVETSHRSSRRLFQEREAFTRRLGSFLAA
jgi:hypothetical protein